MVRFGLCAIALVVFFIERAENKLSLFKPCRVSDPGFDNCLITTAQSLIPTLMDGIPDTKLKGFDPYTIPDVKNIDSPSLSFELKNNKLYGSRSIIIQELKVDTKAQKIHLIFKSSGYMDSDYKAQGMILIIPITGSGKSTMHLDDTVYKYSIDYTTVKGKDGKDHWKITKSQVETLPGKITFHYTNLFNGNKELANFFETFANNNWREIFAELGPPILKKITDRTTKEIGRFFAAVPVEDMIIL